MQKPQEDVYLMETKDGMLVSVPESRLEAWEAAQKAGKRLPDNFAQRLKDALRAEIYGR